MRLKEDFYERNTILLAMDLLGKVIVYNDNGKTLKGRIVETEAYIHANDDAAHFSKGLTERTKIVAETGGHIYMYTIHGIYECLNIVAETKGVHGGALIRGIEPLEGIETMYENRYKRPFDNPPKREIINLTNGPAKFTMAFGITKKDFYGAYLVNDSRIWLEDADKIPSNDIVKTKRINIDYAHMSKDYLLRFYIKDNPFISKK